MKTQAQAILEFTFTMILLMLLIFGIVQVAHWTLTTIAAESSQAQSFSGLRGVGSSMEMSVQPIQMILQE